MKYLLILLLPTSLFAQKKSYMHFYGGLSHSKNDDKGLFGLSVGPKIGSSLGVGFGMGFIKYDRPYLPLTFDLTLLPPQQKITPIAGVKAGYGVYNNGSSGIANVQGGFTGSVFAGISFPVQKIKTNLIVGGSQYSFKAKVARREITDQDNRVFFAMGILF